MENFGLGVHITYTYVLKAYFAKNLSLPLNLNYFWQVVTLLKAVGSGQWAVNHGQWTIYEVWLETNAQGKMSSLLIILKTPLFKDFFRPSLCRFR